MESQVSQSPTFRFHARPPSASDLNIKFVIEPMDVRLGVTNGYIYLQSTVTPFVLKSFFASEIS